MCFKNESKSRCITNYRHPDANKFIRKVCQNTLQRWRILDNLISIMCVSVCVYRFRLISVFDMHSKRQKPEMTSYSTIAHNLTLLNITHNTDDWYAWHGKTAHNTKKISPRDLDYVKSTAR